MSIKRFKLFLCVFIPILSFFLMSHNTLAVDSISNLRFSYISTIDFNTYTPNSTYTNQTLKNNIYSPLYSATINANRAMRLSSLVLHPASTLSVTSDDFWDVTISTYLRSSYDSVIDPTPLCPTFSTAGIVIDSCEIIYHDVSINMRELTPINPSSTGLPATSSNMLQGYYSIELKGHFNSSMDISTLALSSPFFAVFNMLQEGTVSVDVNYILAFTPLRVYQQTESEEQKAAEKELESTSNIENQTPEDTAGSSSENQQTTSLISVISSFVSSLSHINTNGSCQLTLPFPELLGGNQVVNPCNGADKAPSLITTASSLLLITIFVPLAFILIKMIYNEIRSFTNG